MQYPAQGSDRGGLAYSAADEKMIVDVAAAAGAVSTIVVANAPGAVTMPWAGSVALILLPFCPGQVFGDALKRLLLGDVSPSGRLPIALPRVENEMQWTPLQWPGVVGKVSYDEELEVGYHRYCAHGVAPASAFGHALTYSTSGYGPLALAATDVAVTAAAAAASVAASRGAPAAASCARRAGVGATEHTENVHAPEHGRGRGLRGAAAVPGFPTSGGEPPRLLAGSEKVHLAAGSSAPVVRAERARPQRVGRRVAWLEGGGRRLQRRRLRLLARPAPEHRARQPGGLVI